MKNYVISTVRINYYSILVFFVLVFVQVNLSAQIKVVTSGDVGIGTSTPEVKLHVEGVIRSTILSHTDDCRNVCADTQGNLKLCDSGGDSDNLGNHMATQDLDLKCNNIVNSGNINFCNGGSLNQNPDGSLVLENASCGIGINPNSVVGVNDVPSLAVAGLIWANSLFITSDQRFKKNITQLPNALSKIKQINAYSYKYHQEAFPDYNFQKGETYGFLAQEVEKIAPELVQKSNNGYYSVNYIGVIPLLSQAIKEQQLIIELKAEETQQLQQKMEKLALEVAELKALVQSMNKE